jgi:hypothetical protein
MGGACLVPGLGYGLKGDCWLFLANFLVLQGMFLFGLLILDAPLALPELNYNSAEFSLINLFVLAAQLLNGAGSWVAAVGYHLHPADPVRELAGFLGSRPWLWYADLGGFFLGLPGVLNFFAIMGTWDRYYGLRPDEAGVAGAAISPAAGAAAATRRRSGGEAR